MPHPTVLVCFAVPEEAAPFHPIRPPHAEILVTGMGPANARQALLARLAPPHPSPTLVLTCGFAGGLNPDLPRGSLLVDLPPNLPPPLSQSLAASGAHPARFHSSTRIASSILEKSQLRQSTGADAVEMESGTLREICLAHHIPAATIRVVSDAANEPLPVDFNQLLTPDLKLSFPRLAAHLLSHPSAIPGLLRLRRHTLEAARRLATALAAALQSVPVPAPAPAPAPPNP